VKAPSRNLTFTVVVPFRNSECYIRTCVEHLLAQDFDPEQLEILFVDNGSTDGSAEIVKQFPRVRLLQEPRPGAYAARNRALREAQGSLVAFTDSDCAAGPRWLASLDRAFRDPSAGLVLGQLRPHRETTLLASLADFDACKVAYICEARDPLLYYGFAGNLAIRRALLVRYGPFVERARGADTFFVRRVVEGESASVVRYCPDARVRHLELDSALSHWRKMCIYGRSMMLGRDIIRRRNLTASERIAVYRQTVRDNLYPPWRCGLLLGALAFGLTAWNLGRLAGRWSRSRDLSAAE
jgi:glycosyltransferase involved in cell wall biosynthesis